MIKTIIVVLLGFICAILPAHAGVLDPAPIFKNIHESPPESSLFSKKTEPIFCSLNKKFYDDSSDIEIKTIILESLGEGYRGMVAVGEVIRNRTALFHKDSGAVCRMPKQFSCWNDSAQAEKFLEKYRDYYFVAATAWIESKKGSLTLGATDYHTVHVHPYWADAYQVAAHIGKHIFYVRK